MEFVSTSPFRLRLLQSNVVGAYLKAMTWDSGSDTWLVALELKEGERQELPEQGRREHAEATATKLMAVLV